MQQAYFNAYCDLEIGDKVKIKGKRSVAEIHDILAIHSIRNNQVSFIFQVSKGDKIIFKPYTREELIYPINRYAGV